MRAFVHRSALISCCLVAAAGTGCSGSSTSPRTAGPIVIQSSLESTLKQPTTPLAPGQSVTSGFVETRCRYQMYTYSWAKGQYALLGCDSPFTPATVVVTIAPISSSNQPCGLTASVNGSTVVFTKTGPGDPSFGGAPNYFCRARIADPTVHDPANGFTFLDL